MNIKTRILSTDSSIHGGGGGGLGIQMPEDKGRLLYL
jgi:hypothetical protein